MPAAGPPHSQASDTNTPPDDRPVAAAPPYPRPTEGSDTNTLPDAAPSYPRPTEGPDTDTLLDAAPSYPRPTEGSDTDTPPDAAPSYPRPTEGSDTDTPPDATPSYPPYPRPPGWPGRLAAASLPQARRWLRWAWLAALAWWVWNTGLLLVWVIAPAFAEATGDPDPEIPARIVIYYGVEGFLVGMLGLGVNFRWRLAAALLPAVFLLARIIALTRLEPLALDARGLVWAAIYLLLLLLFLRGAQGVFSYHWYTRPENPPPAGPPGED